MRGSLERCRWRLGGACGCPEASSYPVPWDSPWGWCIHGMRILRGMPRHGPRATAQDPVTLTPFPCIQRHSFCFLALSCSELIGENECQL